MEIRAGKKMSGTKKKNQRDYEQVCKKAVVCTRIIQEIDCGLARAATLEVSPQRAVRKAGKGFAEANQG